MESWQVTFETVVEAGDMKEKLLACKFYTRHDNPKSIEIQCNNIVMTIPKTKERQSIMQACSQTFKKLGKYKSYRIEATGISWSIIKFQV